VFDITSVQVTFGIHALLDHTILTLSLNQSDVCEISKHADVTML